MPDELERLTAELAKAREIHREWVDGPHGILWFLDNNEQLRHALRRILTEARRYERHGSRFGRFVAAVAREALKGEGTW